MKVHILSAEHFSVPGLILKAFATAELANQEAIELVNIMVNDSPMEGDWDALPDDWQSLLVRLQDYHGAAHCYVEIVEGDLIGSVDEATSSILLPALKLAEDFMSGFEGDELQDGIDERLATIRAAIASA